MPLKIFFNPAEFVTFGYYCLKCDSLCRFYEQGLVCDCAKPWDAEYYAPDEYPEHWIEVSITVTPKPK